MSAVPNAALPTRPAWRRVKLAEVCSKPQYGWTTKAAHTGSGLKLLRTTDITTGEIDWSTVPFCTEMPPDADKYLVREGDILISRAGSVGVSHLVRSAEPAVFASYLIRFRPGPELLPKYLAYFLKSPGYWNQIAKSTAGIAVPNVNASKLQDLELPLAPLEEQRRIIAELEKQFSRLDEAVANLKRVKANLRRQRAAVLRAAVAGTLLADERSTEWIETTIGDVGEVISGLTKNPKREGLPRKLPYLRVANVYANELRLDEIEYIGVADRELDKLLLRQGDLLIVEGNGSLDQIGRVALWDGSIKNCVHQNHLIKVRFGDRVMPQWSLTWLLSPGGRREIERVSSSTSGLHTLSTGKVARLPIPVPPIREQQRIVAEVEHRLSIIRETEAEVDVNLKRAQALQQAVLAEAFLSDRLETRREAAART